MDREKVIQGAQEFFFGSVTMVLIVTGSYSWRNDLNLRIYDPSSRRF